MAWKARTELDLWIADHAAGVSLACCLPSLAAALWLLHGAAPRARPPAPRGWPGAALRGLALCALLSAALALYQALGGHPLFWIHEHAAVSTGALLGFPLGLLTLVEARPLRTRRARWGWTACAGVGAVGALLAAWVQSEYLHQLYAQGLSAATTRTVEVTRWLLEDPVWTAWHFAWVGVVWAAVVGSRLRERVRRLELALAWAGVSAAWVAPRTPAADAAIVASHVLLCALAPLAFRVGDALQARAAAWLREDAPA